MNPITIAKCTSQAMFALALFAPVLKALGNEAFEIEHRPISFELQGVPTESLLSLDGSRFAVVCKQDDKQTLYLDGKPIRTFDELVSSRLTRIPREFRIWFFSEDNESFAFAIRDGQDQVMIRDSKAGPRYEEIQTPANFLPGTDKLAYRAKKNGQWGFAVDSPGKSIFKTIKQDETRTVIEDSQRMTADAVTHIYAVQASTPAKDQTTPSKRVQIPVVNGVDGPVMQEVKGTLVAPQGGKYLIHAIQLEKDTPLNRAAMNEILFDGKSTWRFRQLKYSPKFSEDGKHWCAAVDTFPAEAKKGKPMMRTHLLMDGKLIGPFDDLADTDITLSPSGGHYAITVLHETKINGSRQKQYFVIHNGKKAGPYKAVFPHVFSPNGERLAYVAKPWDSPKWVAVIDGQPGPEYERIHSPIFSENSKRIAYQVETRNKQAVVVDGRLGDPEEHIFEFNGRTGVFFSPDGKRYAYTAADKSQNVSLIVDGKQRIKTGLRGGWNVRFTENSKHIFIIESRSGGQYLHFNGKQLELGEHKFVAPLHEVLNTITQMPDGGYSLMTWTKSHGEGLQYYNTSIKPKSAMPTK